MIRLNIHEAKTHLSEHLDALERGELDGIVICRRNVPIAEVRPLPRRRTSPRAILRRDPRFTLDAAFFEPLPDDLLDAFDGR